MIKTKNKSSIVIPMILFCISPLLFLPFVIRGMRKCENWAFVLFAVFLGLWAWLTIPFADLFRHAEHYYGYFGQPYSVIWEEFFLNNKTLEYDIVIPTIDWLMVNNGVPYQYLRLFEIIIGFSIVYSAFINIIKRSEVQYSAYDVWKRFMILALFFELMSLISGVRYGMAVCFYVYGLYWWYNRKNRFVGCLFLILAVGTHMSFSVLIPMSLIATYTMRSKKTALVFLALATPILTILMVRYSDLLGIRAVWYLDDGNSLSGQGYGDVTIIGLIVTILRRVPALFFGYFAWKNFDEKNPWGRTAVIWTILAICFFSNNVLWMRMSWLLGAVGIFSLLGLEKQEKLDEKIIKCAVYAGLIATLGGGLYHKTVLYYSHYEQLVYPIPKILQHEYSEKWMHSHIDNNTIIRDTRGDFYMNN